MYCGKCGKQIPDDSNFCSYCGNTISTNTNPYPGQSRPLQWEFKEIYISNSSFKTTSTLTITYAKYPSASGLIELWQAYKPQILENIRPHTAQGWEPDPNFFGETCLEYKVRHGGFKDLKAGEWFIIVLSTLGTFGIGLLIIIPLVLWGPVHIVEPTGVRLRLRRLC